ncbi:hypothetical protein IFHNHDMJ_00877 [Synechococcus sp. CBW1107]|nr:hypothetical protein IFHNHDMJ_00877 [Synechococcus sp. CBW1107]
MLMAMDRVAAGQQSHATVDGHELLLWISQRKLPSAEKTVMRTVSRRVLS